MKKLRLVARHPLTMLMMISSILFVSCGTEDYINTSSVDASKGNSVLKSSYSGEDLFESIIFADGPVTPQIEDLADFTPEAMGLDSIKVEDFRTLKKSLINDIKAANPKYMTAFKTAVTSGDPVQVQEAVEKAQVVVYDALKSHLASNNVELEKLIGEYNNGNIYPEIPQIPVTVNGVALVVVITVVLVIGIAVAVLYTKVKVEDPWEQNHQMAVHSKNMKKEKVYAAVANKLKS